MYKGVVDDISFLNITWIHTIELLGMNWDKRLGDNYQQSIRSYLIAKHPQDLEDRRLRSVWLALLFVLENIEVHGTKECIFTYGITVDGQIAFKVEEPKGGFDLKKLPYGKGGCGYDWFKKCPGLVYHSSNGAITYLISTNNK